MLSSKVKKKKNKAGQAFKDAASTLWQAQNPLGDYLRRKKAKSGAGQAVIATARKMASIYYKMVTCKVDFEDEKIAKNNKKYLEKKAQMLEKKLLETKSLITEYQRVA